MGGLFTKIVCSLRCREMRVLMLGFDSAGKTTILNKLKQNQPYTNVPTVGFNVEAITFKNVKFRIWDVGGQDKIRPLWRHYYTGTQGLIYVIDSSDQERVYESLEELMRVIRDESMKGVPILIFLNKQDMPSAMKPAHFQQLIKNDLSSFTYHILPTVATTGEGLYEGLSWLTQYASND